MTDIDVDVLCLNLSHLPVEELRMLEFTKILPDMRLAGVAQRDAVAAIRRSLQDISMLGKRLNDVAWIYCWLIPRDRLHSWVLYRFSGPTADAKNFTLHKKIANAFCSPGMSNAFQCLTYHAGRYACLMTREPESGVEEHCVICLCAWVDIPYLAVRVAGVQDIPKLRSVLQVLLEGELYQLIIGCHQELSTAWACGVRDFNLRRATSQANYMIPTTPWRRL